MSNGSSPVTGGCRHWKRLLTAANGFAVYVGRGGVRRWVDREVRVALDRNTSDPAFRVIPILGPGSDEGELPYFLKWSCPGSVDG